MFLNTAKYLESEALIAYVFWEDEEQQHLFHVLVRWIVGSKGLTEAMEHPIDSKAGLAPRTDSKAGLVPLTLAYQI